MYFKRAKILSYDAAKRTAQVHIHGLTDGASQGLTATFAYPVGDDDRDTERQIVLGNDVYVFFEDGDESCPVIAFYSSHGIGAEVDKRRIRQKNIELLARSKATIEAPSIELKGETKITGNEQVTGNVIVGSGATGVFSNVFGKTLTIADGIVIQIS
jgi:hypothetical protein